MDSGPRFSVSIKVEGAHKLVDCGLDKHQAAELVLKLENEGHEIRVDLDGSLSQPSEVISLVFGASPRSGRCAA